MQLPSVTIERAHIVGQTSTYPLTTIARFDKFSDREAALNAKKLKGTGSYTMKTCVQSSWK